MDIQTTIIAVLLLCVVIWVISVLSQEIVKPPQRTIKHSRPKVLSSSASYKQAQHKYFTNRRNDL